MESEVCSTPTAGWEGAVAYSSLILICFIAAWGDRGAEVPHQLESERDVLLLLSM